MSPSSRPWSNKVHLIDAEFVILQFVSPRRVIFSFLFSPLFSLTSLTFLFFPFSLSLPFVFSIFLHFSLFVSAFYFNCAPVLLVLSYSSTSLYCVFFLYPSVHCFDVEMKKKGEKRKKRKKSYQLFGSSFPQFPLVFSFSTLHPQSLYPSMSMCFLHHFSVLSVLYSSPSIQLNLAIAHFKGFVRIILFSEVFSIANI